MYNRYFPFGLVSLATYLKENGYPDVRVYDADFNEDPEDIDYSRLPQRYQIYLDSFKEPFHPVWREAATVIEKFAPDLIGISIWTTFAAASFYTAKIAKQVFPKIPVVMGGPHASAKADEILNICPHVDFVIQGESEKSLTALATALKTKNNFDGIAGLAHRIDGKVVKTPPSKQTVDLNQFPFPDRSLLMNVSSYNSEDMGLIMTSRGCPYACTYCATNTKRVSYRSAEHIIAEIKYVKDHYGTVQFTFKDDSFTVNTGRVETFCHTLLASGLKINWECNTRVNLVNETLLGLMKKAGCNFIKVGVESGSESILKSMNKGITHAQVIKAADLFRKVGIHWTGYFMMGVPGETEADIQKTIDFMYLVCPDFAVIDVYTRFPGTVMFNQGIEKKLVKKSLTYAEFFNTIPSDYYKEDQRQTDLIDPQCFAALEIETKKKVRAYNRNYKRVIKMGLAKAKVYFKDVSLFFDDFKKFLSY